MKELAKADQDVLHLLSEGLSDNEVCERLRISVHAFGKAVKRIEARAVTESDDAGRYYERALKKRAQRLNVSLSARLQALMDVLPQAVLVVNGRTGVIKEFNQIACDLFGYTREELVKTNVDDLVPPEFRAAHPAFRFGFLASVRKREMGYHPPIYGVRKDGSVVEMAIALTATTADDDVMVVCTERSKGVDVRDEKETAERT